MVGEGVTPKDESSNLLSLLRLLAKLEDDVSLSHSLQVVARMAAVLTRGSKSGVFLEDKDIGKMRLVASYGLDVEEASKVTPIEASPQDLLPAKRSIFIPRKGAPSGPKAPNVEELFGDSTLWVAIWSKGQPIGRIVVAANSEEPPDETTQEFLRLLGIYAGSLVRNARLFDSLQRRANELSALYEIGSTIVSSLDLDRVLDMVVDGIVRLTGAGSCSIMLLDEERQYLRIRKARGLPEEVVKSAVRRIGEGVSGIVAQTGKPLFIGDVRKAKDIPICGGSHYRSPSLICVPLKVRDQVIGVLNANDKQGGDFTPEDMNLVTLFANQAAIAIHNAMLHHKLWQTSITDGLTQTLLKSYFKEQFARLIQEAKRAKTTLAIIMVDLDHFKDINDKYGHLAGDEVLKQVALLLRKAVRAHDLVARYGGEEFILVFPGCSAEAALKIAERLRRAIEETKIRLPATTPLPGTKTPATPSEIRITASFGVAMFPGDGQDVESLVAAADLCLLESKRLGRNRVTCSKGIKEQLLDNV